MTVKTDSRHYGVGRFQLQVCIKGGYQYETIFDTTNGKVVRRYSRDLADIHVDF